MIQRAFGLILLVLAASGVVCRAQVSLGEIRQLAPQPDQQAWWRGLGASLAVQAAATGFDAWTSWQRPERNALLANGGRFTAQSAAKKAGLLAGVAVIEVLVVKKWGNKHPWLARACRIGNVTSAGMLFTAGVRNLGTR